MNLIEALRVAKETECKIVKRSWMKGSEEKDYTSPSYICWNSNEEAFVAVFGLMDTDSLPDTYARVPEDYMGGVIVSNFSVSDILDEDWEIYGAASATFF